MTHSPHGEGHLEPDDVAAIAAEAAPTPSMERHLESCSRCRSELAAHRDVVDALRQPIELTVPSAELWNRLQQDLADEGVAIATPRDDEQEGRRRAAIPLRSDSAPRESASAGESGRRRGSRTWSLVAAAVVGVIIGAGGVALFSPGPEEPGSEPTTPVATPVAVGSAQLEPVTEDGVSGEATMTEAPDGQLELQVEVSGVPSDGYREVWLRDEAATQLISLGTLSGSSARLPVPQGVDLAEYPVVDVSQEAFDGDPSHSGLTLAAGGMQETEG